MFKVRPYVWVLAKPVLQSMNANRWRGSVKPEPNKNEPKVQPSCRARCHGWAHVGKTVTVRAWWRRGCGGGGPCGWCEGIGTGITSMCKERGVGTAAADKLRASTDTAEYSGVVLGLSFVKYISDAIEALQ